VNLFDGVSQQSALQNPAAMLTVILSCVHLCPPRNRDVSGVRLETTLADSHVLAKSVASLRAVFRCS
jgi:hypothetical protein